MSLIDLTRDDHAYFFGFFQTDGHLSASTRNRGRASIELSVVDAPILHAFSELFPQVRTRYSERTRVTNFSSSHTAAVWTVHDRAFREDLIALGVPVGRKSDVVAPPTVPFDGRGYLRGLVDGDGSVGFTGAGLPFVSFMSASEYLAQYFCAQVLTVTGAVRTLRRNSRDDVYGPMVTRDPAAALAAWLYPPGCLALPRKSAAAADVAAWKRPDGMRTRPSTMRRWTLDEDAIVQSTTIRDAALRLGRSESAVSMRRCRLRHPDRY